VYHAASNGVIFSALHDVLHLRWIRPQGKGGLVVSCMCPVGIWEDLPSLTAGLERIAANYEQHRLRYQKSLSKLREWAPGQSESTCSGVIAGVISVDRIDVLGVSGFDSTHKKKSIEAGELLLPDPSGPPLNRDRANPETVMQSRGGPTAGTDCESGRSGRSRWHRRCFGPAVFWVAGCLNVSPVFELTEGILAEAAAKGWPIFMLGLV